MHEFPARLPGCKVKSQHTIIRASTIEYAFQIQNILQTGMGQLRDHFFTKQPKHQL